MIFIIQLPYYNLASVAFEASGNDLLTCAAVILFNL